MALRGESINYMLRKEAPDKGPKIMLQCPLRLDRLWAHPNRVVEGFNHLLAIDTNTKVSNGGTISITGIVHGGTTQVIVPGETAVAIYTIQCLEFRGIQDKPENVAWVQLIQALRRSPDYNPALQFDLPVDSDLSRLEMYNTRELPIYDQFYFPRNMKFIYASSQTTESAVNRMLAIADKASGYLLDYIIRERLHQDLIPVANEPFTHFKKWEEHMLPRREFLLKGYFSSRGN
jgi:hypothetical protein